MQLPDIAEPMKPCRECQHLVSGQARACPNCGAPYPSRDKWDGWGFEYKTRTRILGMPFIHISFKFRPDYVPVPARGFIAIGQFATGVFTLAQFSIGVFSIGQFVIAGYALAQFAFAYSLVAQIGIYVNKGYGQIVKGLGTLLGGG
jgi:hypothetical protein